MAVQSSEETLLGLVTLTDLRHLPQDAWRTTPVSQIMTPADRLRTVSPTVDLRTAIGLLANTGYHQLPVMEGNHMIGLLNRDHVMQYLQPQRRQNESGRASEANPTARPPRQLVS